MAMVISFAGGVRDAISSRGYVEVGSGEIVAVDLSRGTMLWRRAGVGRPIAATPDRLLTLDVAGNVFVVRFLDGESGADAGQVEVAGMPNWAQTTGLASDAVQVTASEMPEGVELRWRIRQPYRGGAPPPRAISANAESAVTGSVIVDPQASRVVSATSSASPDKEIEASRHQRSSDPHVFAVETADDRTFTLEGAGAELALEARAAVDNQLLWRLPLATQRTSRPPPLRK
jgi:hypothetical protein